MNELFEFSASPGTSVEGTTETWKVLSVEDDQSYQDVIALALANFTFMGKKIELIKANSAAQAATVLSRHRDISLILLDIIMETDDAGFYLIDTVRNILGDSLVRIVLLTGQPGINPRQKAVQDYDIAEYWNKADLDAEKLTSIVMSNLRTWQMSHELYAARRGLQMIVDASRALTAKQDVDAFAQTVLEEIAQVISVPNSGGIICALTSDGEQPYTDIPIVAASQHFRPLINTELAHVFSLYPTIVRDTIKEAIATCIDTKQHVFDKNFSVLFFDTSQFDDRKYLMLIDSPHSLDDSHVSLLQVFAENISSGFVNQALMDRLSQLAYLDMDFNLQNRNWLIRELNQLNVAQRNACSLLLFRLQNLDATEMMVGHHYANDIRKALVVSLKAQFPTGTLIASWDEDTVAVVFSRTKLPKIYEIEQFRALPLHVDTVEIQQQVQVGILHFSDIPSLSINQVAIVANLALNKAKFRNLHVLEFDTHMLDTLAQRMNILSELKTAISEQQGFYLALQPKVDMQNGQPVGFEALLRWQKPDGTLCPPCDFIPIAEASGMSLELSELVLHMTVQIIRQFQNAGYSLPVSFNLAYNDVSHPAIYQAIESFIKTGQVKPSMLEIEITESQATQDYQLLNPVLSKLIKLGVNVSIDDFGTGYSSLSQLTNLVATTIKVDRQFVHDLTSPNRENALHVIQMIARVAHRFNFDVIAEGIESKEQERLLLENDFKFAQGFLYAKPMPLADVLDWLTDHYRGPQ